MKIKTNDLIGPALDWAVAKAEGRTDVRIDEDGDLVGRYEFDYSTDWAQGGTIIEREGIGLFCNRTAEIGARFKPDAGADWRACPYNKLWEHYFGPTPLTAAMRCYVASKMGDDVEVPDGLVKE